jgi:hypothetical protein
MSGIRVWKEKRIQRQPVVYEEEKNHDILIGSINFGPLNSQKLGTSL